MGDPDDRTSGVVETKKGRIPARRDRDRILYSTEFRRLAGVTQVASATEKLLIHNRITHSTKVEQVAMAIVSANDVRAEENTDPGLHIFGPAVEWRSAAAGLGHDLGHPPFGHIGEEQLHSMLVCEQHRKQPRESWRFHADDRRQQSQRCTKCELEDGFEGNAQSFRIVTKLSVRGHERVSSPGSESHPYRQGLDLTRGTLAALTKYPWLRGDNADKPRKWGAYDCDAAELAWALELAPNGSSAEFQPTVEAQVMDWADDITYAVHDIDDFFRLGIVPLHVLRDTRGKEFSDFFQYAVQAMPSNLEHGQDPLELKDYVENQFGWLPERPYLGFPADVARINGVVSEYIDLFIEGTEIRNGRLKPIPRVRYLNEVLKQLTWYYVIDNPALSTIQTGQKRVLEALFEHVTSISEQAYLGEASGHSKTKLQRRIPVMLKYYVIHALNESGCVDAYPTERERLLRGVVDFLSSLTDVGAYKLYARLTGDTDVSMLEPSIAY